VIQGCPVRIFFSQIIKRFVVSLFLRIGVLA
jgi:hypothetical protein